MNGVSTLPGQTQFTRMLFGANSNAKERENAITPPLLAQ